MLRPPYVDMWTHQQPSSMSSTSMDDRLLEDLSAILRNIRKRVQRLRDRNGPFTRPSAGVLANRAKLEKFLGRRQRRAKMKMSPQDLAAARHAEMEEQKQRASYHRDDAYSSIAGRHPVRPLVRVELDNKKLRDAWPGKPEDNPITLTETTQTSIAIATTETAAPTAASSITKDASKPRREAMSEKEASLLTQVRLLREHQKRQREAALSAAKAAGLPEPSNFPLGIKIIEDKQVVGGRRIVSRYDGQQALPKLDPDVIRAAVEANLQDEAVQAEWAEASAKARIRFVDAKTVVPATTAFLTAWSPNEWCSRSHDLEPLTIASICMQMRGIEEEQHRRDALSSSAAKAAGLPEPELDGIYYEFGKNQSNFDEHVVGWRGNLRLGTHRELLGPQALQFSPQVAANATISPHPGDVMGKPAFCAFVVGVTALTFVGYFVLNGFINSLTEKRKKAIEAQRLEAQRERLENFLMRADKAQIAKEKAKFLLQATGNATPETKAKEQLAATGVATPEAKTTEQVTASDSKATFMVDREESFTMLLTELLGGDPSVNVRERVRKLVSQRSLRNVRYGLVPVGVGLGALFCRTLWRLASRILAKSVLIMSHPGFYIVLVIIFLFGAAPELLARGEIKEKKRRATEEEAKTVLAAIAVSLTKLPDADYYTDGDESCWEFDDESESEDANDRKDAPRSDSNATLVEKRATVTKKEKSTALQPACGHKHLIDFLQTENDQQNCELARFDEQVIALNRRYCDQVTVNREAKLLMNDYASRMELCRNDVINMKSNLASARDETQRYKVKLEEQERIQRGLVMSRDYFKDLAAGAKKENVHLVESANAQIDSWKMQAHTFDDKARKLHAESTALSAKIMGMSALMDGRLKEAHEKNDKQHAEITSLQAEFADLQTELAARPHASYVEQLKQQHAAHVARVTQRSDDFEERLRHANVSATARVISAVGNYGIKVNSLSQNNTELSAENESLKAAGLIMSRESAADKSQIASLMQYQRDLHAANTKQLADLTTAHKNENAKLDHSLKLHHARYNTAVHARNVKLQAASKREAELTSIVEREHTLRQQAQDTMRALQRVLSAKESEAAERLREEIDGVELAAHEADDSDAESVISEASEASEFSVLSAPREDAESEEEDGDVIAAAA